MKTSGTGTCIKQLYAAVFRGACGNECSDPGNSSRCDEDCNDWSTPGIDGTKDEIKTGVAGTR